MKKHNPENERIKHRYFAYLKEAEGKSEASIDAVAKALSRFEVDTGYRDFKSFRYEQAIAFKDHLAKQVSLRTGEPLSKATLRSTLNALRNFFRWLAGELGYRSHINRSDAQYFSLPQKDSRIASAHRERSVPTLEQIRHVLRIMPSGSEIERRDKALIAFTILTGARDGAIASVKLKHVDVVEGVLYQDAREVNTKASKTITTWFFPVGEEIRTIVVEWVAYLRTKKLWGLDDPLFPATKVEHDGNRKFVAAGTERKHWSNAGTIRAIFKTAFERAGFPYFHPHSFRKTLVQLAFELKLTPEQFKGWSQNLGHEEVLTTFTSYGAVAPRRQAEIIRELQGPKRAVVADEERFREIAEEVFRAKSAATLASR